MVIGRVVVFVSYSIVMMISFLLSMKTADPVASAIYWLAAVVIFVVTPFLDLRDRPAAIVSIKFADQTAEDVLGTNCENITVN